MYIVYMYVYCVCMYVYYVCMYVYYVCMYIMCVCMYIMCVCMYIVCAMYYIVLCVLSCRYEGSIKVNINITTMAEIAPWEPGTECIGKYNFPGSASHVSWG